MISSKRIQLIIILIVTCMFVPLFAAEPNEPSEPNKPTTELRFETSIETMRWEIISEGGSFVNPGPVKPSYVANVLLHEDYPRSGNTTNAMSKILKSPISMKFSKEHQEFLETELAIRIGEPRRIPFYHSTWLYATSAEDAKLMVQAYIDGLNMDTNRRMAEYKQRIAESEQELDEAQKYLPEQQKQLEEAEKEYKMIKNVTHEFASDEEAVDLAKKSITEMDKKFNELDIELAGIRERLKTIEEYKKTIATYEETYKKLDEMSIELTIELSGLEARREVTEQIYGREQRFLSLFNSQQNLQSRVRSLNRTINNNKEVINRYTIELNDPAATYFQPPKVYMNTVTIYPVLTDN